MIIILVYNEVHWGNTVFTCFLLIPNQISHTISTLKSLEVNPSSTAANYTLHICCWGDEETQTDWRAEAWWTGLSDGENTTPQNYIMVIIYREAGLLHTNKEAGLANLCRSHLCRRERSSGRVCREKAMVNIHICTGGRFCHSHRVEALEGIDMAVPTSTAHSQDFTHSIPHNCLLLELLDIKPQRLTHARSTFCHWAIFPSKYKMI